MVFLALIWRFPSRLSWDWRASFIRTYLERDLPGLGLLIPSQTMRRFWMMLARQIFNASDLSRSMGFSNNTASRYLDILSGTFMIRRLAPWYENMKKRQVKRPKIYFRDSGLLHSLLGVPNEEALLSHPKLGASWEGFAREETIRSFNATEEEVYFWAVHQQLELDLLLVRGDQRLGFEFKYSDAPRLRSNQSQLVEMLSLDCLTIVCPGSSAYACGSCARARPGRAGGEFDELAGVAREQEQSDLGWTFLETTPVAPCKRQRPVAPDSALGARSSFSGGDEQVAYGLCGTMQHALS